MTATGSLRRKAPLALILCVALLLLSAPTLFTVHPTLSATASAGGAEIDPALSAYRTGTVSVIIQKASADAAVEAAVLRVGGTITRPLPIVNGFAAAVPARALATVAALPGVRVISLDRRVLVAEGGGNGTPNSVYPKVVRSDDVNATGNKGQGITVAVIDTGVASVPDLSGRIVAVQNEGLFGGTSPCKNFSGEPDCADSYGHGTFVSGIIAGNGASSGGKWKGVAPQAKVLSVKIAGESGASDVSTLLAAIQWVVSYKSTYNIKVLNLSLGTNSTQTYRSDPMNYAVEKAWDAGIVVVVSASNLGPEPGTISKPGDDPWVITVGATDDNGTPGLGDDAVPSFSGRGPTGADGLAKPDVVAPGAHVISLRAPGSAVDQQFPNYVDGSYRKASGTSFSTGMVTGTAALMLQANPSWSPNRVKYALTSTARPNASSNPMLVGAGLIDAYSAAYNAPAGSANAGLDRSTGLGSLDASRGDVVVASTDPPQTLINGLLTAQWLLFDQITYVGLPWTSLTWQLSQWAGNSWHGNSWHGNSWHENPFGNSWHEDPFGNSWHEDQWGNSWHESTWYGNSWHGSAWYGAWE